VAFRPTITRGLALSAPLVFFSVVYLASIFVPKRAKYAIYLILKDYLKSWNFREGQECDLFCFKWQLFKDYHQFGGSYAI
jgi:hypothetical protein